MRTWLRDLDEDAASGDLWGRPVFFVPLYVIVGVLVGVTLGYASGAAFALTRPNTSLRPGPDGSLIEVAHDYTAVPIVGGFAGGVAGLVCGVLLAVRRWRRSDEDD